MRVCFLLGALGPSGGVRAVLEHARRLARDHGMTVSIALDREPPPGAGPDGVELLALEAARERELDVALATWWRTAYRLFELPARRHALFVQQLEERVYRTGDVERLGAAATTGLPVAFLTEARWIAELLRELRPDVATYLVPNGVDKDVFTLSDAVSAEPDRPLRVLVEGSPRLWYKGVEAAGAVLARTSEPTVATLVTPEHARGELAGLFDRVTGPLDQRAMAALYRETDVLLKLSRVEGVFTPPLEAFHLGATCVVWPVTGHDEYVRHGENGVVTDFDDVAGTAAWIDLLARDRALLARLREGALETAREWPSWDEASARMAAALAELVAAPAPASGAAASHLLSVLDVGMEAQRLAQMRLRREVHHAEERHLAAASRLARLESTRTFRARAALGRVLASLRR